MYEVVSIIAAPVVPLQGTGRDKSRSRIDFVELRFATVPRGGGFTESRSRINFVELRFASVPRCLRRG